VRKLDEILGGLCSSSTSNLPHKNEIKKAGTAPGAASEGCFCQGKSPLSFFSSLFDSLRFPIHYLATMLYYSSSGARIIRIHTHLLSAHPPVSLPCALQLPHHPCSSCMMPLLAPPAPAELFAQLGELRLYALKGEAMAEAEEPRLSESGFPRIFLAAAGALSARSSGAEAGG
jgi:hypothetical protein